MPETNFDFSGQDELSTTVLNNFDLNNLDNPPDNPVKKDEENQYDFSGQDDFSTKKKLSKVKVISKIPLASATQGGYVVSGYGQRKPPKKGASSFHEAIDIKANEGMDVSPAEEGEVIEVGQDKGKGLHVFIQHADGRITEYNHLSKTQVEVGDRVKPEAIIGNVGHTGVATGPHLDFRVRNLSGKYSNPIDELELDPRTNGLRLKLKKQADVSQLDFSGQDEIAPPEEINPSQFDFSGQDETDQIQIGELPETPYVDRRTYEEKVSAGAYEKFGGKPKVTVTNPHKLIGDQISVTINAPTEKAIDRNDATDRWLNAIDPNYGVLNAEYRSMSGRNLVDFDVPPDQPLFKPLGNNQYQLTSRLQSGAREVINAYINGRNKGGPEAGWEAAYFKGQEIKRQHENVVNQLKEYRANEAENYAKDHPYLNAFSNAAQSTFGIKADTESIGAGLASTIQGNAQLLHNLRTLPYGIYMLERYGGNSPEYQEAMEKDIEVQRNLNRSQSETYQPEDIGGKITKGFVEGVGFLPKAWAVAPLGPSALPLLVYAENFHRGNREATKHALTMALMSGASHGLGEFLTSGKKVYSTFLDKEGNAIAGYEMVGRGLGNKAPFVKIPEAPLSLSTNAQEAFLSGESVSIGSLTPLQRQLLMRGSNALFMSVPTALEGGGLKETVANFVVGLTFPVGKYKVGSFDEGRLVEQPVINSPSPELLEQGRVDIPLDKYKLVGTKDDWGGFEAWASPSTLRMDLDTAALNLLDLRRALKNKSIVGPGVGLKESMKRFADVQVAIKLLEEQIPKETIEWFEKNEGLIRSSLKTNWEAVKAKEEYLGQKQSDEPKTPDEIKPNTGVDLTQNPVERLQRGINLVKKNNGDPRIVSEVVKDNFGNAYEQNTWITPDRILTANGNLARKLSSSKLGAGIDPTALWDLTVVAAGNIEDFYHRKIEPTVSEVRNRIRLTLGNLADNIDDKTFLEAFNRGKEYFDSNQADPFFSKMKQDALEKLPNRFTEEQARNILSQHENEFSWTAGLSEFLEENKEKRINKKDLIDIINNGQVGVEASVASEELHRRATYLANRINFINNQFEFKTLENNRSEESLIAEKDQLTAELRGIEKEGADKYSPKYSLKAYTGEKLELPGAVNSKEVKLISVDNQLQRNIDDYNIVPTTHGFDLRDPITHEIIDSFYNGAYDNSKEAAREYFNRKINVITSKYNAPHWEEPNVVAHYRSNDRVTTDNIPISFSEEFQSDWNHDIRTRGLKRSIEQIDKQLENAFVRFDDGSNNYYLYDSNGEAVLDFRGRDLDFNIIPEAEALTRGKKLAREKLIRDNQGIEPNPFMQHSWKELVFKRFLRDAVVARDENGNNKYEGIGWTTARQQVERYGKILEGKDFSWYKLSDGTYTFTLFQNGEPTQPHELNGITLERFAELTTKEAAEEVRSQEAKIADTNETTIKEKGFPISGRDLINPSGKFSLKEAVELRSGIGKYSDYDVAFVNYAKKVGKRFGSKYSQKEVNTPSGQEDLKGTYNGPDVDLNKAIYTRDSFKDNSIYYNALNKMVGALQKGETTKEYVEREMNSQNPDNVDIALVELLGGEIATKGMKWKEYSIPQKIHFLEITPSMRESLSKEGFPLYGLSKSEPLSMSAEPLIRNRIVTADAFDQARNDLVQKLTKLQKANDYAYGWMDLSPEEKAKMEADFEIDERINPELKEIRKRRIKSGTFNSGLNPDAFIDQIKLLYQGYKDLVSFTKDLVQRYGEPIRQFAEDFWWTIKGKSEEFNNKLNIKIENIKNIVNDPAWQIRQAYENFNKEPYKKGTSGTLNIGLGPLKRSLKSPELEECLSDPEKHQSQLDFRYGLRGIALSQLSTEFGKVYDSLRIAQRVVNNYQSNIISQLKLSRKLLKAGLDKDVAETIYAGNETQHIFSDPELTNRGLNADQIKAYRNVRAAIDNVLNLRLETKLHAARAKANKLNDKLLTQTPNTPEHDATKEKLIDLNDAMVKMSDYYQKLKDEGYISLQRRGKIAAFVEDTSQPATITRTLKNGKTVTEANPDRKIYNHFNTKEEADKWVQEQKKALGIPTGTLAGNIYDLRYDIKNLKGIAIREKLTPSQFEDLVDRAGVKSNDPLVEKIREEVYSKYPSFTYELHREYIRGYDRTWKNVVDSVVHQADLYGSSFYSKVGGEEAFKQLEQTGIEKSDPNLYKISLKYINDEITAADNNFLSRSSSKARKFVYFWQLGYDINQLYLNAVAQPITQTYGYFSRVNYNGKRLTGFEPETYFLRAGNLVKDSYRGKASQEFKDIVTQLTNEHVLAPEFTQSLIRVDEPTGSGLVKKVAGESKNVVKKAFGNHWASVFMQMGEHLTRTHAAAEAFLVGKEKFNLAGDDLIKFMVKAVDATQSNPTRGENPYFVRSMGEGGKLVYQFMAFNQMWWENLALGVKQTSGKQRAAFLARELVPLGIMGGLRGLPLSGFALALYTIITGNDPRKDLRKLLGTTKGSQLEAMANYGITGSAGLGQKLTPSAPVLDQAGQIAVSDWTDISRLAENIPAVSTGEKIVRGFSDLTQGRKLKAAEELLPRAASGIAKSLELQYQGNRDRQGNTIESRKKVTTLQTIGQAINISPNPVIEHYEERRTQKLKKLRPYRKLKRFVRNVQKV